MKVVEPGHVYLVDNVVKGQQEIQFVQRRGWDAELLPEEDQVDGIQSQELLRVLIDRTLYLHAEQPWQENVKIVHYLRDALKLYESRAARRHIEKLSMPERAPTCTQCGHLLCFCEV